MRTRGRAGTASVPGRVAAAGVAVALAAALAAGAGLGGEPKGDGLRVYHIGNSHTHSVRNVLMPLAVAAGHTKHTYSWSSILGAPLRWIWDHEAESGGWEAETWSKGLAADRSWDALTLQVYASDDREMACAVRFAELAYKGNPKCQVYIYTIWPGAKDDWARPPADRSEATTERCAEAIARAFPQAPAPRVLPTSLVLRELGRLADDGQVPRVASRFQLLSDGGHLSDYGNYAVNVTFCSMLYDEPPLAYPHRIGSFRRQDRQVKEVDLGKVQYEISPETADVIKRVVWDVLSTYPAAKMDVGLVIADRSLPPALVKRPYRAALRALNLAGRGAWSLAGGTLPAGLTLSGDGAVSGTPEAAGRFAVAVRVADGGRTFERPLALVVSEDRPPEIVVEDLAKVPLDQYVFRPLQARGGVGGLAWSLGEGRLPYGVSLARPGILVGTPGEAGEFRFKVRATDAHPSGGRSDEKAFAWTVGPASREALLVRRVAEPPAVDGRLDEPCWTLDQAVAKKVAGAPTAKAAFSAVWFQETKGGRKDKGAVYLAVKVTDGPAGKAAGDAVGLFIDAMHNREVVYNADDTHLALSRAGKVSTVRGRPWWFLKAAAAETDGGYVMEVMIPESYFYSGLEFGAGAVYGFDVGVVEGGRDGGGRLAWRGTEKNPEDTSGFGSLVLTGETAPASGAK